MTEREQKLSVILLCIFAGVGLFLAFMMFYATPVGDADTELTMRANEHAGLANEVRAKQKELKDILTLHPRLEHWEKLSLPEPDKKAMQKSSRVKLTEEQIYSRHLNSLQVNYQRYLEDALRENKIKNFAVTPKAPETKNVPLYSKNKPIYRKLSYSVVGQADLQSLVGLFREMHTRNLLHQIRDFTLSRPRTQSNNNQSTGDLDVQFTIDALLVTGAEQREDILPKLEKGEQPVVLAREDREYYDLLRKNPFFPVRERREGPQITRERIEDVLSYVRLTGAWREEGKRSWMGTLINLGNQEDITTVSTRAAWSQFKVRDKFGEEVLTGNVEYLDKRKSVISVGEDHYLFTVGGSLQEAMNRRIDLYGDEVVVLEEDRRYYLLPLENPLRELTDREVLYFDADKIVFEGTDQKLYLMKPDESMEDAKNRPVLHYEQDLVVIREKDKLYVVKMDEALEDAIKFGPISVEKLKEVWKIELKSS